MRKVFFVVMLVVVSVGYSMGCEQPKKPIVQDVEICGAGSTTINVTSSESGISYKWYTSASGTSPIHVGANNVTPVLTATRNFYVSAVSESGCYSDRVVVAIKVKDC